jgi:ADP-ribose pyrophosphatase
MTSFGDMMNKKDVKVIKETCVYQGFIQIKRYVLQHKLFQGGWSHEIDREIVERRNAAGVLLYDPVLDKVVMIEQFRAGALGDEKTPWLMEVVAGLEEPGEPPEELIMRETKEEAGLDLLDIMPISEYWSSPGGSNGRVALFCGKVDARNAGGIHGLAEEAEDIRVHVMQAEQAFQQLRENKINNAMSLIALMWLELNREKVRKKWLG